MDTQEFDKTPTLLELLAEVRRDPGFGSPILVAVSHMSSDVPMDDDGLTQQTGTQREPVDWMKYYAEQYANNRAYPIEIGASSGGIVTVTIGRSKQCGFRIPDESVSSQHAKLLFDRGRYEYFLIDEHSRNGTHLNGERLRNGVRTQIWSGAFVSFGNSVFVFLDAATLRKLAALKG